MTRKRQQPPTITTAQVTIWVYPPIIDKPIRGWIEKGVLVTSACRVGRGVRVEIEHESPESPRYDDYLKATAIVARQVGA